MDILSCCALPEVKKRLKIILHRVQKKVAQYFPLVSCAIMLQFILLQAFAAFVLFY